MDLGEVFTSAGDGLTLEDVRMFMQDSWAQWEMLGKTLKYMTGILRTIPHL